MPFYFIVLPTGKNDRNLNPNPSFELGTTGMGTIQAGTVGTTSAVQAFGAWSGSVATTSNGTAGYLGNSFTAGNGTDYTFSFYGSFPSGSTFRAGMGDSSGANLISGSFIGTGVGAWQRYSGTWTEASGAARRLTIRKNSDTNAYAFYVDAIQYEAGSLTTYIDGDQGNGYIWDGQPHNSTSVRLASVRTGGTVVSLSDLGFTVLDHSGVGMPDVNAIVQPYAQLPGGFYQDTRAESRALLLTGLMSGTTWQHLHAIRQAVINTLKPDLMPTPQPVRILYTGAGGSVYIDCVYDSGLGFSGRVGFTDTSAVRLIAPDPYWRTILEDGTALSAQTAIGSTNYLAYRSPTGQWGTLGNTAGSTVQNVTNGVTSLAYLNGTLFVGGDFGTAGGTRAFGVAQYVNGAFGTLTGGTLSNANVRSLSFNANGTLFIAGNFTTVAGTVSGCMAQYVNGGYGTLAGGTLHSSLGGALARVVYVAPNGTVFVGGAFTEAGGTATYGVAMHLGPRWGTFVGGTLGVGPGITEQDVRTIVMGKNGLIYLGGRFGSAGGTVTLDAARWSGSTYGTMGPGGVVPGAGGTVNTMAVLATGEVMAGVNRGGTSTFGAGTFNAIALWNDVAWRDMNGGVAGSTQDAQVNVMAQLTNGQIVVAGNFQVYGGGTYGNFPYALNTGAAWLPSDIQIRPTPDVAAIQPTPDGGLFIGGLLNGTALVASVTTQVNAGAAAGPIRCVLRAPTNGTARVYQLLNTTANDSLYFNLVLQAGEIATLDTTPGSVSFVSSFRGNILGAILPGSNLSRFRMQPGTNTLSFFADNTSLRTDLIYRPRYWSNDGTGM